VSATAPALPARRFSAHQLPIPLGYAAMLLVWQYGLGSVLPELALDRVVGEAFQYVQGPELWTSFAASLQRIAIGYAFAAALGVALGLVFGLSPKLEDLLDPLIAVVRPISPLGWLPFAIVWFGVSEGAAVFLIAYAAFFPIFLNTLRGVRNMPITFREAAVTLGAGPLTIVRRVMLPAALPSVLTGLRLGMGLSWSAIVAAELAIGFVLQAGIGYLMLTYAVITYDLSRLVVLTLFVAAVGLALDTALRKLVQQALPWREGLRANG